MTTTLSTLLITYLIGGLTFLPLCFAVALIHAYLTCPVRDHGADKEEASAIALRQPNDGDRGLLSEKSQANLLEKFRGSYEPDVAAGYFAVCREYVPGGVNGKPPERTTPAGIVIGAESPSVYQSMYRSIFDRRQAPTLDTGKPDARPVKRASNVFYVVLRHGHLMLYEDSNQVEVKHVISLEHHRVSVYGGEDEMLEGELWIRKNAIHLARPCRPGEETAKPFFLFSDNCSDKEDFYFALLRNQLPKSDGNEKPPRPLPYDPAHIIGLVQRLHSSEEQLQTRWINGLIGRIFLSLYKTSDVKDFLHNKITKKIARVKKPAFLTGVALRRVDLGNGAPQITNPKLRDLTMHGDCCAEADIHYTGNIRLEVAATARLDLGPRFKAREVDLVLAVVVKRLSGHVFLKLKPPPSNRMWIAFEEMPDIDLAIEPIVSSRQITYGLILRAIRSRILEVIADTIVLPNWDDIPFTDTTNQTFRGGIWSNRNSADRSSTGEAPPSHGASTDADLAISTDVSGTPIEASETKLKQPSNQQENDVWSTRAEQVTISSQATPLERDPKPRALRSSSFAAVADPLVSPATADSIHTEKRKHDVKYQDAAATMSVFRDRSRPNSPEASADIVPLPSATVSNESITKPISHSKRTDYNRKRTSSLTSSRSSSESKTPSNEGSTSQSKNGNHGPQYFSKGKKSLATLGAATAMARKLGWAALSRQNGSGGSEFARAGSPANPIGRGQPLPPPGQPLPSPKGRNLSMPVTLSTQKATSLSTSTAQHDGMVDHPIPLPAESHRRRSSYNITEPEHEGILVVEAPSSEPPSPIKERKDVDLSDGTTQGSCSTDEPHPSNDLNVSNDLPVEDTSTHVNTDAEI